MRTGDFSQLSLLDGGLLCLGWHFGLLLLDWHQVLLNLLLLFLYEGKEVLHLLVECGGACLSY